MRESLLSRHRKGMEISTKKLSTWRRSSASEWELRGWSLRENCLVPDIGKFLEGLWRQQEKNWKNWVKKGNKVSNRWYTSRQAEKQNNNCMTYITRSCCLVPLPGPSPAQKSHHKLVRNPEAIPSEPCNKNYVDMWLADQLAEKENHLADSDRAAGS